LPVSEYFFYLDVSPEKLVERVKNRNEKEEMFENYDAFVKVRQKAEPVLYNWHVIPADDSPEEIFARINVILDELDSKLITEPKKLE
jgi:dTMP kinase